MIKFIRSSILKSIKSKRINVFLLFFLLSFLFLILTKLTKDYTKTLIFQIKPINAVENFVILKDTSHKLDITLRTYGFNFLRYYLSNPSVTVDLQELDRRNNQYIWTNIRGMAHLNSQFGESVELMAVNPDSIIFNFDRNEVIKVPIKFNADVTFEPGFDLAKKYQLIPDSIKIMGPTVLLDSIYIVQTEVLIAKDIKTDIDMPVNLILPDSSENLVYSHKKIMVKGKVDKFTEGIIEVPVDIKNVPSDININYFPKAISVSYYTSLANFKEIKKKDFIIECDYKELVEGRTYLEPVIKKYPEKVKNVKLNNKRIEFIISE